VGVFVSVIGVEDSVALFTRDVTHVSRGAIDTHRVEHLAQAACATPNLPSYVPAPPTSTVAGHESEFSVSNWLLKEFGK
jgi:hypothetical protein